MVFISGLLRWTRLFPSVTLLLSPMSVSGQSVPAKTANLVEKGHALFVATCSGCHGSQAQGSDHAPALVGNRRLRSRSTEQVRAVIQRGIPSNGMPAFDLPPEQLDALSEFVHSLNSAAADTIVPGDPQRGRAIFFGKGGCGSCDMVSGVGSATGPDLSSAGTSMTVSELREVLVHPDRSITPGYQLVTVSLRNGSSVHGFARGRTNFDLQVQDLNGNFHLLQSEDIASVEDEQGSVMKPFAGTAEETQDLVAYLSHLKGQSAATEPPTTPGASDSGKGVDFTRLLHAQRG